MQRHGYDTVRLFAVAVAQSGFAVRYATATSPRNTAAGHSLAAGQSVL